MEAAEMTWLSLLEQLPLEVIEVIAQYLSAKDVGACCATSQQMRELFSNNAIWKPRCTKDLGEYLIKTPCKVEPGFKNPESKNSTLSPVSKWRKLFMYENHLWNNWRQGKYKKEKIKKQESCYYTSMSCFDRFLNNDCVIFRLNNRLELFDVRGYPPVKATEPVHFVSHFSYHLRIKVVNDQIITLYKTLVHVYQPDFITKQCPLKHAFLFEDAQKVLINTSDDITLLFDKTKSIPFCDVLHVVVGKFYVGIVKGQPTMHIWDINSGVKLKEQVCPLKSYTVQGIAASSSTMNLVLTVSKNYDSSVTFLAYSLTNLVYLPFKETFDDYIQYIINNNLVAIWNNNNCVNVFNYETSDLLLKDEPAQSPPKILRNCFIFHHNSKLRIFNPSTRLCTCLDLEGVQWYKIISSRFIQVQRYFSKEIWEFGSTIEVKKKTSMGKDFNPLTLAGNNEAFTRYLSGVACENLLNFW